MRCKTSKWAGLVFCLCGLLNTGSARAASEDAAADCRDTSSFALPEIGWMGKFAYKVSIRSREGRPEDVKVQTVRGPDRYADRTVTEALQKHVQKNYVCGPDAKEHVFYVVLNFTHEVAALAQKQAAQRAAYKAEETSAHAAAAASAAAAVAADVPAGTLVPVLVPLPSAGMICTAMGRPEAPRINAIGTITLHVIADVTDGRVTLVDAKIKQGSPEPALNRKFIDLVSSTMRDTYRCPGNHVFEQEFMFSMS